MTREFNQQRRDDSRPSSRTTHFNGYGAARPPRPGRPRLNRETVDRAWESGAQYQHADYNPRDGRGPAERNGRYQRQDRQESEQNSFQRRRGYNNENGHYRNDYHDTPRNGEYNRRDGSEPRQYHRRDDRRGPRFSEERYNPRSHDQRDFRSSRNTGAAYRDRDQQGRGNYEGRRNFEGRDNYEGRGNFEKRGPRRNNERDNRSGPPAHSTRSTHSTRSQRYNESPSRFDSYNERGQGTRGYRPGRPARQNDTLSHDRFHDTGKDERFEGDYEQFTFMEEEAPRRPANNRHIQNGSRAYKPEAEERHVTPLPDGRVLKGSRPSQRKQAQYWTNIAENTDELLSNVHTSKLEAESNGESGQKQDVGQTEKTRRPRSRVASEVVRKRKSASGTAGPIPRPSQRGFKWPTP